MVGSVIRDSDLMQSLPKSLRVKLARATPQLLELGKRSDAWNIMDDVRQASRQISSAKIRGIKLEDQLRNRTMFGEGPTERVQAIAKVLDRKETEVSGVFRAFAKEARSDVESQATMFGAADPIETFDRIFAAAPSAPKSSEAAMRPGEEAFAGERPILPSLQKMEMPKELVRRSEILEKLSKGLGGLPIRLGRIRTRKALGVYKVKPEVIRLRQANDIGVATHEAGHHINKLMFGGEQGKLNWQPLREFRDELDPIATPSRKGESSLPEGFAEFVRLYVTSPGEAIDKAPRFHQAFEKKLAEMPEIRDVLIGTRKDVRRYVEQPALAKVLSHISLEETPAPKNTWSRFYTHTLDSLHPVKKGMDALGKLQGKKLATEEDAYLLARLFAGWFGKANHFLEVGTFDPKKLASKKGSAKDPGQLTLDITGKPLKDILRPFEGEYDELSGYLVARRVEEKSAQGKETGISIEDAKAAVKEVETPELKKAAEELYKYGDESFLYLSRSRFMSSETADVIREMNRNHVPFYRVMDESTAGKSGGGKTMADLWDPVKRMKGSTREIIDPLESIVKNTYAFINLAERNKIGLVLAEQAAKTEGGGQWVEEVPANMMPTQFTLEEIKSTLKDAGVEVAKIGKKDLEAVATIFRPMPAGSQRENILSVFKDGKRKLLQVQPDLYRAMKGMDVEVSNIVIRMLAKPARAVRLGFTQANPAFALVNVARDVMLATVQSRNGFNPLDMFRGLAEVAGGSDLFNEFTRSGGMHSALVALDRTNLKKNLEEMMASKVKMIVKHPIEVMKILGEYSELSTRVGEYRKARLKGKSVATSGYDAREVTVDFFRMGDSLRAVNQTIPFFNATIQSTDRLVRAFKENPKGFSVKAVAGITVPSLILYAINKDDEDYKELPSWQKDFFWMIPTKGTPLEKETKFLRIPKPFLLGLMFGSVLERGMTWINDRDPRAFDGFLNSLHQTSLPSPFPAAMQAPMELWANKSLFTGRDLVPGFMENLPAGHQYNPWTTDFAKSMSRLAGSVGVPVSPIKLEHLLFSYTGGAGPVCRQCRRSAVPIGRNRKAYQNSGRYPGGSPFRRQEGGIYREYAEIL